MALKVKDKDFITGALTLAYAYTDTEAVLDGYEKLTSGSLVSLAASLRSLGKVTPKRAEKLERATNLMIMLRDAAIYGTIALNNKLIGEDMLNACMEENRRKGFKSNLGSLLQEKGVLTPKLHEAIVERCKLVLSDIAKPHRALAADIDLANDPRELSVKKLEILIGEVASKLSFLTKDRLEDYLRVEERVRKGLPADEAQPQSKAASPEASGVIEGDDPIANYEVMKKLGAGAMGAVYKARKKDDNQIVALKVLKPDLSNDQEFVQRFLREAKAVARLNHQNIIRAIDVGRSGKFYYFAMEFVDGEAVAEIVKRNKTLPERACLKIVKQIALALDHAWKNKIIHRDVKPDNLMVTKAGVAKLTDLGLARTARESTLTLTGVVMGSPAYISPEQATGEKNLDTRSDIYSLGATLYHMLTGEVPYDGESPLQVMLRHMNDPLPDVRRKVPTISEGTRQLIFKMMAKRPESRFQNARQLYDAIISTEKLLSGTSIEELSRSQAALRRSRGPQGAKLAPGSGKVAKSGVSKSGVAKSGVTKGKVAGKSGKAAAVGKKKGPKSAKKAKNKEIGEKLKKLKKRRI